MVVMLSQYWSPDQKCRVTVAPTFSLRYSLM